MKLYGSLQNRMMEGRTYCDEITVGTGMTEYMWSDREPYEVTAVRDQKHVTVRRLDVRSAGETGSEWEFISRQDAPTYDLVKIGETWYWIDTVTAEDWKKAKEQMDGGDFRLASSIVCSGFDPEKILRQGKQTKRRKANVSFGTCDYYYDPEF